MILWHNHYFYQSSPIIFYFIFSSVFWVRIQDIESTRHGLPLPIRLMDKLFKVSTTYFVLFVLQGATFCLCLVSLATSTGVLVLTPDFVFNLTSWHHLIMMGRGQMLQALVVDVIWAILCLTVYSMIDRGSGWLNLFFFFLFSC